MKPIIIIKEKNKDGKFELTEKELKELIEKAYEQGFEEGKEQNRTVINPNWWEQPIKTINLDKTDPIHPHDIYGNPIPYCSGTTASDPKDNRATLTQEIKLNGSPVSTEL